MSTEIATSIATSIAELVVQQADLREELDIAEAEHKAQQQERRDRLDDIDRRIELMTEGITAEQIELAESLMFIRGRTLESAEGAFEAAKTALARGGGNLTKRYIGAKRYDGFHQRSDHEYGYGPKHGGIVFAVGLLDEPRKRVPDGESGRILTPEESEACVRFLLAQHARELKARSNTRGRW